MKKAVLSVVHNRVNVELPLERLAWFESEAMSRVYAMRDELCAEHPGRF